jgi:hypothetical protein
MKMQPNPKREQNPYPHSKKRVIVNSIVAVLSAIFAVFLLASDIILLATYFAAAAILTILIFLIKERLSRRNSNRERRDETQDGPRGLSIKTLLITFIGFLLLLTLPLLSAGLVEIGLISAASWFITIISVTTGIGTSEVLIYLKSRTG